MANWSLIGKKTVYIGGEEIEPEFVADEAATITVSPSTTEVSSQLGTVSYPNGAFEELSATVTIHVPNMRFLGKLFPGLFVESEFDYDGEDERTGQVRFGAYECKTTDPVPVIIHNTCADDSRDDIQIPNALIANGGEFTISLSDPFDVELQITPQPGTEGAVIMGEGSLSQKTLYNPETQTYEPVSES